MPQERERIIARLERALELLRSEQVDPREVEQWAFFPISVRGLAPQMAEVHRQLDLLRDELLRLRREPVRCSYTEDRSDVIHMLTGVSGELERERKYIRKKAHSNEWMIIADPYFLQWDGPNKSYATEKKYTEFIVDYIPKDLKKLELFVLPGPNRRIQKTFGDRIRGRGTKLSVVETAEIHDRVVIRDNNTATLLGTSFGGFGNKLSFVLEIPDDDLKRFMEQLDRIRGGA